MNDEGEITPRPGYFAVKLVIYLELIDLLLIQDKYYYKNYIKDM